MCLNAPKSTRGCTPDSFDINHKKLYPYEGVTGKDDRAPSPEELLDIKEIKGLLNHAAKTLTEDNAPKIMQVFNKELPEVVRSYQSNIRLVPQWADRDKKVRKADGSRITPIDWIKMHYGRTLDDGTWDPDGLKSSDLNKDRKLYIAYMTWIRRHPEEDLCLPKVARRKKADPLETLKRHREASLASYHRNKGLT